MTSASCKSVSQSVQWLRQVVFEQHYLDKFAFEGKVFIFLCARQNLFWQNKHPCSKNYRSSCWKVPWRKVHPFQVKFSENVLVSNHPVDCPWKKVLPRTVETFTAALWYAFILTTYRFTLVTRTWHFFQVKRPGRWDDNPDKAILEMAGVTTNHSQRWKMEILPNKKCCTADKAIANMTRVTTNYSTR